MILAIIVWGESWKRKLGISGPCRQFGLIIGWLAGRFPIVTATNDSV